MKNDGEHTMKKSVPATIIELDHGKAVATSIVVAEKFGKKHSMVMRAIRNLECPEDFIRLNFALISVNDRLGREQQAYQITRDGFTFLAMGFTGKEAAEWKIKFLSAFNKMEKTLLQRSNAEWHQARLDGKPARRELTDTLQHFVEYAKAQGSTSAERYYSNVTSMVYKALGIVTQAIPGAPLRDFLDRGQVFDVSVAEKVCRQAFSEGMYVGMHYKAIYQYAKDRVNAFMVAYRPEPLNLAA